MAALLQMPSSEETDTVIKRRATGAKEGDRFSERPPAFGRATLGCFTAASNPHTTAGSLCDPESCPGTRCSLCFKMPGPSFLVCLENPTHPRPLIRLQFASLPSAPRPLGTPLHPCHTSGCTGALEHDCPSWAPHWHPAQGGPRDQAQRPT